MRNQLIQEAIKFADKAEHGYTPELMADFLVNHPRTRALENLAETVGMWCESCPVEVQRALHAVPGIEAVHFAHSFVEPETRRERLRKEPPAIGWSSASA